MPRYQASVHRIIGLLVSVFQDVLSAKNSVGDTALNVAVRRDFYEATRHILSKGKHSTKLVDLIRIDR